jgi:hypothetical protein
MDSDDLSQVAAHATDSDEPTGVSLKAAYLLLRELNKSPEPPNLEHLALLLDRTLHYEWAVRLIRITVDAHNGPACSAQHLMEGGLEAFNDWANENLLS